MNKKMGFTGTNLQLSAEDFERCPEMREQFKIILNGMLGKLAQRPSEETLSYISSHEDLKKLAKKAEIINIGNVSNDFCEVTIRKKEATEDTKGNCIIYAFVTARARIRLHQHLMELCRTGYKLYYTDCDSIIFTGNNSQNVPLPRGLAFGDFKPELGENTKISKFVCHGRKNFQILYEKESQTKSVVKVKGLSLQSNIAKQIVSEKFSTVPISKDKIRKKIAVPQLRRIRNDIKHQTFYLSQNISCQRITESESKMTLPWGYRKK